jgi:hypothetical protein
MAYDYTNPQIGNIVYRAFEPKKPGRIVNVQLVPRDVIEKRYCRMGSTPAEERETLWEQYRRMDATITVQTAKGDTFDCQAKDLKDFKQLVDETQKKADNHKARLTALEQMP